MRLSLLSLLRRALITATFNTAIAIALTVFGRHTFSDNLAYSMAIGLSIWLCIEAGLMVWVQDTRQHWRRVVVLVPLAVLLGYLGGTLLGDVLAGQAVAHFWLAETRQAIGFLLLSLIAGGAATWFFLAQDQLAQARLAHEAALHQASEAHLRLLQSQLEPHMLFNTLANLRVLIGTDPPRALTMLDRLNDYLRATLASSRAASHSLAEEFERLQDYLELMALRMGERLQYTLTLPEALRDQPVPPLLLQPLVENAIRHGLEPHIGGGQVNVQARVEGPHLLLTVQDNGQGLPSGTLNASGFGLTQVRERLATRYGPQASLAWHTPPGGGLCVCLTLPQGAAP